MKIAQLRCLPLFSIFLQIACALLPEPDALASDAQADKLPEDVARVFKWLPEDTETLVVARSTTLAHINSDDKLRWSDIGREQALEGIDTAKHLKPIQGCGLKLVVRGSRHYESVSSFGSLRAEDCAILQSGADQGFPVVALKDELRQSASATRTLAGRDVFVFPSTIVTEPWVRRAPWEGVYYVVLDAKTLLFATSDRYLREVLERIDGAPTARALPARLPEWEQVDTTSSCWMLRHFPSAGKNWGTVGTTTRWADDRFEVVYVAGAASTPDLEKIERFWFPDEPTPEQRRKFRLERRPDGAVVFATTAPPDIEADLLI